MPLFGASLTDNVRSIIYNRNMFIKQVTGSGVLGHFFVNIGVTIVKAKKDLRLKEVYKIWSG